MSERRACRVCGCTDDNACVVDGVPCHWIDGSLCSGCAETQNHVVSMTRRYESGDAFSVATCGCGWHRQMRLSSGGWVLPKANGRMDAAVRRHWQAVVQLAREAA